MINSHLGRRSHHDPLPFFELSSWPPGIFPLTILSAAAALAATSSMDEVDFVLDERSFDFKGTLDSEEETFFSKDENADFLVSSVLIRFTIVWACFGRSNSAGLLVFSFVSAGV